MGTHTSWVVVLLGTLILTFAQGEPRQISVLYDSSGTDADFQKEMLKAVFLSLKELERDDLALQFVDVSVGVSTKWVDAVVKDLHKNKTTVVLSLLHSREVSQLASTYHKHAIMRKSSLKLKVFTPRIVETKGFPSSVSLSSMQMGKRAVGVALLNRVEKVGVTTLIPVLDSREESQLRWLNEVGEAGDTMLNKVKFTKPIFIDTPDHLKAFRDTLDEHSGFKETELTSKTGQRKFGVLLLATNGSQVAMELAAERRHMQLNWFSPNILEHEEWAYKTAQVMNNQTLSPYFGLYTVSLVGSKGWDNPGRRRVLREIATFTGASPRILTAVLAYDCATLAVMFVRGELHTPVQGLSGQIDFDSQGIRKGGTFFGVSAVPESVSSSATLLQPSTWILEDIISLTELDRGLFAIQDFQVATSTLLTAGELHALANKTRVEIGCSQHIMNLITHDPFTQMPYNYYFKESSLPENLLIPNQGGFGITFICFHQENGEIRMIHQKEPSTTSLQIACTQGLRASEPIQCFQSKLKTRYRRSAGDAPIPSQYMYGFGNVAENENGVRGQMPQNAKWANPKDNVNYNFLQGFTQSPGLLKRLDTSVSAAAELSTTPAPPPTSKLPELRQILKAAKPFVGSCIGSTTGCAMCVLVLGRLPLGAVPAACTGPCFVGTFGSCGSLLGRVFSETTVICTELFKQGLMDPETFMADAEFGQMMARSNPTTLQGYTLLATPVVEAMKRSSVVTTVVSFFALPWAQHMSYMLGRRDDMTPLGLLIHTLGFPLCSVAGHIKIWLISQEKSFTPCGLICMLLTSLLTIIAMFQTNQRINKFCKKHVAKVRRRLGLFY